MLLHLQKFKDFDFVSLSSCDGAFSWSIVNNFLEKLTIAKIGKLINIQTLYNNYNKHITFVTTNYTNQDTEYISLENHLDMPCLIAIRMSCSTHFISTINILKVIMLTVLLVITSLLIFVMMMKL